MSNRLDKTIPNNVGPVARSLGLPEASLPDLYQAVQGLVPYSTVHGLTPQIQQAVQRPWQDAFISAGGTVFLVSLAFSGTAFILTFFFKNNDPAMFSYVASNVHGKAEEVAYQEELKGTRGESVAGADSGATNGDSVEKH